MNAIISTDPIADMLSRIRNAVSVRKAEVSMPHSKLKTAIAKQLMSNGYIDRIQEEGETTSKTLKLTLWSEDSQPHITAIDRLSTPGRRHYVRAQEIPVVKNGRGIVIVSTSRGLMTGDEAKSEGLGGELICKVY